MVGLRLGFVPAPLLRFDWFYRSCSVSSVLVGTSSRVVKFTRLEY